MLAWSTILSLINRILPWLSIRSKLIIAFTGLSVVPVALVGLHAIFSNVKMMKEIAYENLTHDVHTIRENTVNFLSRVESDLRLLQHFIEPRGLSSTTDHLRPTDKNTALQQVNAECLAFAAARAIYYQIRMVSPDGDELFRIECINPLDSVHKYRVVPASELRQNRATYYFLLTMNLDRHEVVFAPAELVNQNNDRIAVISFAMPLEGVNGSGGILIANVFAKDLFRVMEAKRHLDPTGKVVLVSSDGHYLYHSEKKKDWNKLLASRAEDNLQHDYPLNVVEKILSGREGTVTEGIEEIISFAPLFPSRGSSGIGESKSGFTVPFYVFESIPTNIILGPVRSFAWAFAAFLTLFLATAIGLGLLATRQFTRPIAELQQGAEIIAKGNYRHRLHVETHDEIERLADQFNAMADSLEAHEEEIEQHRTRLEEMVRQRTRELTREKVKLQAILDNVPSAFVLLDKEFRIQTASAAFTAITGLRLEDVRGKDCRDMFCKNGFCRQCVSRQAVQSGQIVSHIDHVMAGKGGERFIEHVAIPMKENGQTGSILEIISDITRRKQFEQHLIQTERLMAAGEMSALIAHEFRNSLTSIKMILQLQRESKKRIRSEQESLDVALNSIYHMERIVTELLDFAKPSPMEFRVQKLHGVIEESLDFVRLHASKHHIQLHHSVDATVGPMLIDAPRLKEAMVNILLNAVQAIEGNPARPNGVGGRARSERQKVSVVVKKVRLRKTIRDFAFREQTEGIPQNTAAEKQTEIVLGKGTECVLIEVCDTGPGIPSKHLHRIFDPFFTTKTDGSGLGLAMVKQTVNAHDGIVTVKTVKGRGATFRLYLPLEGRDV